MQRREEAELLVREAVDILRATYPDGHPQLAGVLKLHGVILDHLMRFAEAQAPLREALELRRRFSGPQPLTLRSSSWISRLH
jgi:Flp pilus assembly protein TadD